MQTLKLTKKYQTYPEYKDSGSESLGKIPKSWETKKLKHITQFQYGGSLSDGVRKDGEIQVFGSNGPVGLHNKANTLSPTIIIGRKGSYGVVNFSQESVFAIDTTYYIDSRYTSQDLRWLYYTLGTLGLNTFSQDTGVPGLSRTSAYEKLVSVPNPKEQTALASYLDEKIGLVDSAIENKQTQIKQLNEKRTAVINYAIVSANGEKGKLKNYIQLNPSKKGVSATGPEDMVSFVPMEAISELGELQLQERKYKDVSSGFTYFRNGDVVLAKITPCYENGKAGVMKELKNDFGFGTTEFMVLRPSNKILADYLYYVVFSDKFRKMGEVEMRGTAGQKRVTSSFVMNYELSIPDIKTQEKIVAELNKKMKMFDVAIAKVETSISYLKEFKTSLISNVVTGKIKV